jgi:hypothetical protein
LEVSKRVRTRQMHDCHIIVQIGKVRVVVEHRDAAGTRVREYKSVAAGAMVSALKCERMQALDPRGAPCPDLRSPPDREYRVWAKQAVLAWAPAGDIERFKIVDVIHTMCSSDQGSGVDGCCSAPLWLAKKGVEPQAPDPHPACMSTCRLLLACMLEVLVHA